MSDNTNTSELVSFYVKIADTGANTMITIPANVSIAKFIDFVKIFSYPFFNIERNILIEIVEAGQRIPGIRGEDAPALESDLNTTIRQRYNGVYENRAFYIRLIQNNQMNRDEENRRI